ncbi:hypothetical protein B566_EDAN004982 [Ephemera danica]|nr:hypothetical protein B566_EDAN004982 [Ephemera danica]
MWRLIKLQKKCQGLKQQNATVVSEFNKIAAAQPKSPCFIFKQQTWTFKQVEDYSWRVTRAFSRRGLVHGDVVALVCTNRPEFVAIWLGLSRLGVVTALINTNLRHEALKHSLNVANPRAIIVSADLCQAILEIQDALPDDSKLLCLFGKDQDGEKCDPAFGHFDQELSEELPIPIPGLPPINYKDPLMYIYTSGTTGFPKAAIVTNSRYDTTLIASKSNNNNEIQNENVGMYIGEICRYLLTSVPSEWDRKHKLRLMTGNGLRTAIWQQFVNLPVALAKVDPDSGEIIRSGKNNFAQYCKAGELGMLVGRIDEGDAVRDYKGYVPNTEGRAGMAAILDPDGSLDLSSLASDLQVLLPAYAQPLFLRITDKLELTGTYKLRKVDMQKEGIDPEKIKDKLYMKRGDKYVEFTSSIYQDLLEGRIRI